MSNPGEIVSCSNLQRGVGRVNRVRVSGYYSIHLE